jgi:hypothetical protein
MPKYKEKDPCVICLNHCRKTYKPVLNCECKYTIHKTCFMKWWKDNNNCLICLKHTNLDMKNANIYRRRLNNSTSVVLGGHDPNLQYDVLTARPGVTIYTARRRRRNNIWREISNNVDLDDDNFHALPIRMYLDVFKCMFYVFIIIILCFYFLVNFYIINDKNIKI